MIKKVKAPAGFHWMKKGKFKPHKNASLMASFKVQKTHGTTKKKS